MKRWIGITLAILGFIWIAVICAMSTTSAHAKYAYQCDQLDKEKEIDNRIARNHLLGLAIRISDSQKEIFWPALMMLFGAAICFGKSTERKDKVKPQPENPLDSLQSPSDL